jgi:hypothetical protein
MVYRCIRIAQFRVRFSVSPQNRRFWGWQLKRAAATNKRILGDAGSSNRRHSEIDLGDDSFGKSCHRRYNLHRGLWYTGNTPPWHGGVRGPIPLRSTKSQILGMPARKAGATTKFIACQVRIFEIPLRSTKSQILGMAALGELPPLRNYFLGMPAGRR